MSVKWMRVLWVVAALVIPATAPGEVVKLKDESIVRGRLVQVNGDTLVFRSSFGTLRVHRDQIVSIVFDDSSIAPSTAAVTPAKPHGDDSGSSPMGAWRASITRWRRRQPNPHWAEVRGAASRLHAGYRDAADPMLASVRAPERRDASKLRRRGTKQRTKHTNHERSGDGRD